MSVKTVHRYVRKPGIGLLEILDQVDPLKTPIAAGVFSFGVERWIHEHTPEDFPRASTRGHFRSRRVRATPVTPDGTLGGLLGLSKQRYLAEGHTETDYDVFGDVPGWDGGETDEEPEEVVVFVHGWLADREAALGRLSLMRHGLEKNGYPHSVVGFTWDSRQPAAEWRTGKTLARWNGPKLAEFLVDLQQRNPDADVRVLSNSLGDRILFSALENLDERGHSQPLKSATVLGGSVGREEVGRGGRYYEAVENQVVDLYSYWTPYDDTVGRYLQLVDPGRALGTGGPENAPENFHDRGVLYVPDHFSLYLPGRGCLHDVVRDWGVEPGERGDVDVTREWTAFEDVGKIPVETG